MQDQLRGSTKAMNGRFHCTAHTIHMSLFIQAQNTTSERQPRQSNSRAYSFVLQIDSSINRWFIDNCGYYVDCECIRMISQLQGTLLSFIYFCVKRMANMMRRIGMPISTRSIFFLICSHDKNCDRDKNLESHFVEFRRLSARTMKIPNKFGNGRFFCIQNNSGLYVHECMCV